MKNEVASSVKLRHEVMRETIDSEHIVMLIPKMSDNQN
jgi:hypothetical protein